MTNLSTPLPAIECRNVWKVFGKRSDEALAAIKSRGLTKEQVLEEFACVVGVADATFQVREGEVFCIMGLSGSGKSTLVRHINRLIEPTAGDILVGEDNINALNQQDLRRIRAEKIGMVFQHTALLPHRNVRENVALSLELRNMDEQQRLKIADDKLALVQLTGWGDRMPAELSGGMQQRVGLARAMAADPKILLMDEPFSALDPLIRRQLQDQFVELAQVMKKTTLFITHDLDEAFRIGHRIAIMKDGAFVQIGTPEEIITAPADDYVAEFVKDISRLKLVFAHTVMQPLQAYLKEHNLKADNLDLSQYPTAARDVDLNQLIDLAADHDEPIVVLDGDTAVGIITKRQLLRGIQGESNGK
ncbi:MULTISPECIES: quaternary amine ABC transporter ATP-binding protein [Marinobacter]|uniref:quaternary amine ABC transporter ATP-binding protein n=1 Tax=Marinobacter TaxID=2742 RepID=UPI0019034643|nr:MULTISPECIES: betaine/proline/choline family ABC transporter ATP-binding protein [unclassified Marinobacter]MBK1887892.1 betaine/proline/choline family ABC transporter ATP-binding protein [Marinobacter sp. DY40_1A1]